MSQGTQSLTCLMAFWRKPCGWCMSYAHINFLSKRKNILFKKIFKSYTGKYNFIRNKIPVNTWRHNQQTQTVWCQHSKLLGMVLGFFFFLYRYKTFQGLGKRTQWWWQEWCICDKRTQKACFYYLCFATRKYNQANHPQAKEQTLVRYRTCLPTLYPWTSHPSASKEINVHCLSRPLHDNLLQQPELMKWLRHIVMQWNEIDKRRFMCFPTQIKKTVSKEHWNKMNCF